SQLRVCNSNRTASSTACASVGRSFLTSTRQTALAARNSLHFRIGGPGMPGSKPKTAAPVVIAVTIAASALLTGTGLLGLTARRSVQLPSGRPSATLLPTGQLLTPTAAPGSTFVPLSPGLRDYPDFTARSEERRVGRQCTCSGQEE